MKSIKDLRESYNLIAEKEEHDMNKLTQLVRAGLFDAKKLSALKRAMDKPADKMTAQEKRMMINLLDALMAEVLSDKQVYRKIKQDVMKESVVVDTKNYLTKMDPRVKRYGYSQKDAPSVLLLKRKAIRVFPDGEKVALYYAQAIDRYVSIPFSEIGINENWAMAAIRGIRDFIRGDDEDSSNNRDNTNKENDPVAKELKPLEREKTKLKISTDDENKSKPYMTGVEARRQKYERDANAAMAKGVKENFMSKLQSLDEAVVVKKYGEPPEEELESGRGIPSFGGGGFNPSGVPGGIGAPSRQKGTEAGGTGRRVSIASGSLRRQSSSTVTRVRQRVRDTQQAVRDKKNVEYAKKVWKNIEAAKAKPKQQPASSPKPETVKPKPQRVSPPKVEPDVKPPVRPTTPANVPEVKPDKKTSPNREAPAYKPKPAARPDVAPTQQPSSQPSPLKKPENQPWKDAKKWAKTQEQPAKELAKDQKKKRDEEGAKKREPKDAKTPRRPFKLPGLVAPDVGAKALASMTPGAAKLNISSPAGNGPSAIRSKMAANERKALKAQATMKESVEINLDGNQFVLNNKEANKVLSLYESLNVKNKKKMIKMMNESEDQLNKIVSFAVRQ